MRKLLLTLVMGLSLTLISGLAIAQQTHETQKSDTLNVGKSNRMMMSMQKKMTQENSPLRRTMTDSAKENTMMGKKMMAEKKMGGKMMMQGHMGNSMMMKKMGSGMSHKGMGMNDPIMMMLHTAGCPGYLLKISDKLELSASQKAQFEALKNNFMKFAVKKNADIKVAKIELTELLNKENFDSKKIKSQISKIQSLEFDLRIEMLKTIEKTRSFLRQDQLNKLKELRNNSGMGMGMMKHGMMK